MYTVTFAQAFKDNNYGLGVSGNYEMMNQIKSKTSTSYIPGSSMNYNGTYAAYYVAVGLWK